MADDGSRAGWTAGDRWTELVSEGHVRAARLRFMQPWLVTIAVGFILVGFYAALLAAPGTTTAPPPSLMDQVERARTSVRDAVAALPAIQLDEAGQKKLAPAVELPQVANMILAELNRSDALPKQLPVNTVSATVFWRQPWPADRLMEVRHGDVLMIGALANRGNGYVDPVRWIGVFARRSGSWQMLSATDRAMVVATPVSTSLENLPLTLKPILPEAR